MDFTWLIPIHSDSTKYFAFATPDGQYEYLRLPFGFCESPAEFQKRVYHVLQSLIREDKVSIYIDDILIPFVSVEKNLLVLKQVMLLLKKYEFVINLEKSQFLGYIRLGPQPRFKNKPLSLNRKL